MEKQRKGMRKVARERVILRLDIPPLQKSLHVTMQF